MTTRCGISASGGDEKAALARHWRWFVAAAIPLDGAFAIRWAQQVGEVSLRTFGRTVTYLVFGFTAAGLLGGVMSLPPA